MLIFQFFIYNPMPTLQSFLDKDKLQLYIELILSYKYIFHVPHIIIPVFLIPNAIYYYYYDILANITLVFVTGTFSCNVPFLLEDYIGIICI